jgi:serine/threonine protein kinase
VAEREHGAIIGTPLYMAPEQAAGRTELMGPAADIYSLGAILYEMLTGKTPFAGTTLLGILHQVLQESPIPPSQLNPDVPTELEAICLRCLEKEPQRRYPSAQGLANDLMRYLLHQPIATPPPSRTEVLVPRSAGLHHAWDVLLLLGLAILAHLFPAVSVMGRLLVTCLMIALLMILGRRQRSSTGIPGHVGRTGLGTEAVSLQPPEATKE